MAQTNRRKNPDLPIDDYHRYSRCDICKLTPHLCVCDELPKIELPFEFLFIQHAEEVHRQSNTGTIAHHSIASSQLLGHGWKGEPFDSEYFKDPNREFYVLFPIPEAKVISHDFPSLSDERKTSFVILDATWKQARRMSRRLPGIRKLQFVTLPDEARPSMGLRKPHPQRGEQLNTAEAAIWTIRSLGFNEKADELESFLKNAANRILHIRGKFKRGDVSPI